MGADQALPLVLLHGWGLDATLWRDAGWPGDRSILMPDLPGYGGRPSVDPYTPDTLVDVLAERMPPACVVLGWSMGGMVAQAWAARHPGQVRGLVLVGSSPAFLQRPDWDHGLPPADLADLAGMLERDAGAALSRFLGLLGRGGAGAREVLRRAQSCLAAQGLPDPAVLGAGLRLLRDVDLRPLAGSIQVPTLVLHGLGDSLCPVEAGRWLARHIPAARLVELAGAAHAPFLSHPGVFHARLVEFLATLPEPARDGVHA